MIQAQLISADYIWSWFRSYGSGLDVCTKQENPTNCGTKVAMCWTDLLTDKHNGNPLNILVHLQLLWLHDAYQFNVFLHLLYRLAVIWKGSSPILGVRRVLEDWDLHKSKAHPRLPNDYQYDVLLYLKLVCRNQSCQAAVPLSSYQFDQRQPNISVENVSFVI